MNFNPNEVTCSSADMSLHLNGKDYDELMTKPNPYKVVI